MQMYHYCRDCDALILFTTWQEQNGRCDACDLVAWNTPWINTNEEDNDDE